MPFLKRHQQIIEKLGPVSPFRLWLNTVLFSWIIFGLCLGYVYLRSKSLSTFGVNQAAANTAVFLIGFSFILSSLCYFFDFFDTKIIYRKHLGVIGFAYSIAHVIIVTVLLGDTYPLSGWLTDQLLPFILGAVAILLFTFMTLISNRYVITHIGGQRWRTSLRWAGYIALIFVWFHSLVTSSSRWASWLTSPRGLPPLSLVAAVFSIIVIAARVILALALWRASKRPPEPLTSAAA